MGKSFRYKVPRLPDEVLNMTVNFWNSGNGIIRAMNYNPNESYSIIDVERGMKMGFFISSYGERYRIIIYHGLTENKNTLVEIHVNLKFGFGLQWNIPNDILSNWAQFVGTTPVDFSQKAWIYYLIIFILIAPLFAFVIYLNMLPLF